MISIHVPRTGHDDCMRFSVSRASLFQSTCPVRGTTFSAYRSGAVDQFQSTCPVRGTTTEEAVWYTPDGKFQSTCPVRGTTQYLQALCPDGAISIHVPRTGHDRKEFWMQEVE